MNKALKAEHLLHAARELAVVKAALDWYDSLQAPNAGTGAHYRAIAEKLSSLEDACHQFRRSELAILERARRTAAATRHVQP